MNKEKRISIFKKLQSATPSPKTELIYKDPFELIVAVILSAQSTDESVNKVTKKLYAVANSPEAIIKLGLTKLKSYIKTIGLYNNKAVNIMNTCHILVEKYDSTIPRDRTCLESLPGVGRKTANVILNTVFGEATIAVDTHIFRISNRTKIATGKTTTVVEQKLLKLVPQEFRKDAHNWLILHGRYTCTARKPKCNICIIYAECECQAKEA